MSAWMDGEHASPAAAAGCGASDADMDTWYSYHLIGDVLRAGSPAGFVCSDVSRSRARAQAYARRIVEQAQVIGPDVQQAGPVAWVPASQVVRHPVAAPMPAANDGVFRWKMLAGFASVAAVAVVAWSVVGSSGQLPVEGAVLADASTAAPVGLVPLQLANSASFGAGVPEPVGVNTPQGVVLRDPRMEELMRTHRQAGGAPAWQVPAGFLRAATHDVAGR